MFELPTSCLVQENARRPMRTQLENNTGNWFTFDYFTFEMKRGGEPVSYITFIIRSTPVISQSHHTEATGPARQNKHTRPGLIGAQNLPPPDPTAQKQTLCGEQEAGEEDFIQQWICFGRLDQVETDLADQVRYHKYCHHVLLAHTIETSTKTRG